MAEPLQGSSTHFVTPRVARRLATLGFEAKSRWDFKALNTNKADQPEDLALQPIKCGDVGPGNCDAISTGADGYRGAKTSGAIESRGRTGRGFIGFFVFGTRAHTFGSARRMW